MTEDQFALKLFPMYRYFVTVWLRNNTPEGCPAGPGVRLHPSAAGGVPGQPGGALYHA
ncbi:unnamed protein product, partial [Rangifer tarandus platyrhynchus]